MAGTETTSADQAVVFWTDVTPKERQVATAMSEGWTNSKIANREDRQ